MKTFRRKLVQSLFSSLLLLLFLSLVSACSQEQPVDQAPKTASAPASAPAPATGGPPPVVSRPDVPVSQQVAELLKSSFILDDVLFVLNSYRTREAAAEYFIPHMAVYTFNETYTEGDTLTDEFLAQDKAPVYSFRLRYDKNSEEIAAALVTLIAEQGEKGKELAALALGKTEGPPAKEESQKSLTYQMGTMALQDGRNMQLTLLEDVFADKSTYTVVFEISPRTDGAASEEKSPVIR